MFTQQDQVDSPLKLDGDMKTVVTKNEAQREQKKNYGAVGPIGTLLFMLFLPSLVFMLTFGCNKVG